MKVPAYSTPAGRIAPNLSSRNKRSPKQRAMMRKKKMIKMLVRNKNHSTKKMDETKNNQKNLNEKKLKRTRSQRRSKNQRKAKAKVRTR